MKLSTKIFSGLLVIGLAMTIHFFSSLDVSQKSFYENAVQKSKNKRYRGVIIKKFRNHGREKIILDSGSILIEMDFVYEKSSLYEYIRIGDTLEKKKDSLKIRIIRGTYDTIIPLKFEEIKQDLP